MPMLLIAAKLVSTLLTVLALAALAERVSPRVAGVLAGFPLGTGIALVFIAIEQGPAFASAAAPGTLLGFIAAQVLAALYGLTAAGPRALAPLLSIAGFALAAALLTRWQTGLWSALAVCVGATFVFHRLLRKGLDNTLPKGKARFHIHLIRGLFAGLVVVLVTGAADISPPLVAGALAAFPITFFPLLVLLHWQYGAATARTLVRHYPAGLGALIAHTVVVALAYPRLGITAGTLLALTAALSWSLLWLRLSRKPA
jgi:hypothetical protein